jgi:Flp pilus assembly protein TadD
MLEAEASMRLKRGKRFETAIKELGVLAPADERVDVMNAEFRELQGDVPAALDAWTKAAKKKPSDLHAATREGYWLSQTTRLDEASEVLTGVLKKQYDAEAASELAFVKFRKEQFDEALKLLHKAVKEKPDLMIAHYYLGAVLYRKANLKAARAEYLLADEKAGADQRPLVALCELEAQQDPPVGLDEVKKKISERFPAEAKALIARCAVPPAP